MKNITLSLDDRLLEAGREYARRHRTTLNALVRELLERAVSRGERDIDALFRLMDDSAPPGSPEGYRFRREDAYDE